MGEGLGGVAQARLRLTEGTGLDMVESVKTLKPCVFWPKTSIYTVQGRGDYGDVIR